MKNLIIAAFILALPLPFVGCDDDDDEEALVVDASVEGSRDASTRRPGTCDPVLQDCPAGQQCTGGCNVPGVMSRSFTCATSVPGATRGHGEDCGPGCSRGHDCYVVPAGDGGTRSVCRRYCNTAADCPGGRECGGEGLVCTAADTMPIGRLCGL